MTCHNRGNHAAWEGSAHDRRNLSCTTCHSVHSPKSFEHQLVKENETAVCAQCHRLQVAKTERAVAHMPVREGKMTCSSRHNPHGSISNVKSLTTGSSVSELCMTCHAEMRAPMSATSPFAAPAARSHSPVCRPTLREMLAFLAAPLIAHAQRIARAGPSNTANTC